MFKIRLKELREKKRLSQKEFAKFLGLSSGAVGNWEVGTREPPFETMKMIADFFDVTVDYLICRTDNPKPPQKEKGPVSNEDLKIALWGNPNVSDSQLEKLKEIAKIIEEDGNDAT